MREWTEFFVATAGSAAALTGLVFVGVSISLTKILSIPKLPNRALISLVLLLNILVLSTLFLVPGQPLNLFGAELLAAGTFIWLFISKLDLDIFSTKTGAYKRFYLFNILIDQLAILPYILCGLHLVCYGENGLYWIVPGFIFSFIKAIVDAWVLLVEINR